MTKGINGAQEPDTGDQDVQVVAEYLSYIGLFGAAIAGLFVGLYMTLSRRRSIVDVAN